MKTKTLFADRDPVCCEYKRWNCKAFIKLVQRFLMGLTDKILYDWAIPKH